MHAINLWLCMGEYCEWSYCCHLIHTSDIQLNSFPMEMCRFKNKIEERRKKETRSTVVNRPVRHCDHGSFIALPILHLCNMHARICCCYVWAQSFLIQFDVKFKSHAHFNDNNSVFTFIKSVCLFFPSQFWARNGVASARFIKHAVDIDRHHHV